MQSASRVQRRVALATPRLSAPTADEEHTSVVIGLEQELTNFNNLISADNLLAARQITRAIYPTCVRTRPDFSFEPYFCESLPEIISEDPLVVEYRLRADATGSSSGSWCRTSSPKRGSGSP